MFALSACRMMCSKPRSFQHLNLKVGICGIRNIHADGTEDYHKGCVQALIDSCDTTAVFGCQSYDVAPILTRFIQCVEVKVVLSSITLLWGYKLKTYDDLVNDLNYGKSCDDFNKSLIVLTSYFTQNEILAKHLKLECHQAPNLDDDVDIFSRAMKVSKPSVADVQKEDANVSQQGLDLSERQSGQKAKSISSSPEPQRFILDYFKQMNTCTGDRIKMTQELLEAYQYLTLHKRKIDCLADKSTPSFAVRMFISRLRETGEFIIKGVPEDKTKQNKKRAITENRADKLWGITKKERQIIREMERACSLILGILNEETSTYETMTALQSALLESVKDNHH